VRPGSRSARRSVATWFRDIDDNSRSIAPGGCSAIELAAGTYRIYVEESTRTTVRIPGPTYFADRSTVENTTNETARYEGGFSVDASLPPSDSVTDVSSLVRGWTGGSVLAPPAGNSGPVRVTTGEIVMTGLGVDGIRVTTDEIVMTGLGVDGIRVTTDEIVMTGLGVDGIRVTTSEIEMTGMRVDQLRITTDTIVMTGRRPAGR